MSLVLLDVDGVIANFVPHLLNELKSKVKPEQILSWKMFDQLPVEEQNQVPRILNRSLFWWRLPVMPSAIKGIQTIRDRGHQIVFVTTPWRGCPDWNFIRTAWLKQHFNVGPEDIIFCERKELIRGDVFIDDKTENVKNWVNANPRELGIVFTQPWNRDAYDFHRMNWEQITNFMGDL